jgi:hypothetical protein
MHAGDSNAGFTVALDAATNTVRVGAWGFWPTDVAAAFSTTVIEACRKASRPTSLFIDMSALKPLRDEGQAAWSSLMKAVTTLEMTEVTVMTTSHLTRLQLLRLARRYIPNDSNFLKFISGDETPTDNR